MMGIWCRRRDQPAGNHRGSPTSRRCCDGGTARGTPPRPRLGHVGRSTHSGPYVVVQRRRLCYRAIGYDCAASSGRPAILHQPRSPVAAAAAAATAAAAAAATAAAAAAATAAAAAAATAAAAAAATAAAAAAATAAAAAAATDAAVADDGDDGESAAASLRAALYSSRTQWVTS
ncbi:hypothetical protein ALC57_09209 [Trachymyrmex cornetzi]|uniref:Uncharacterized protein n=1 Tax=Trachymyrmex cornetzi TaxID=471704 RepID=A0A195E0X5_9HYME|nr:hypothetical protein ALC57_09209 [Trachymyrmex cornetzi]